MSENTKSDALIAFSKIIEEVAEVAGFVTVAVGTDGMVTVGGAGFANNDEMRNVLEAALEYLERIEGEGESWEFPNVSKH